MLLERVVFIVGADGRKKTPSYEREGELGRSQRGTGSLLVPGGTAIVTERPAPGRV